MPKLDLRLRDLNTGEAVNAMFESEDDACTWLQERPRFTQVLGVATHGLEESVYKRLRALVRPLDPEEDALRKAIEAREEQAWQDEQARQEALEAEETARYREALKTADPNRPMAIEWTRAGGFHLADPLDPREITAEAREAVLAWVRERDEWVREREQVVGEALLTVWPGPVPDGASRVQAGGQFFPAPTPKGT